MTTNIDNEDNIDDSKLNSECKQNKGFAALAMGLIIFYTLWSNEDDKGTEI